MSKLKELTELIKGLQKLGLTITEEQMQQIRVKEREIIESEVVPIIQKQLEPMLENLDREITVIMKFAPNQPVAISIEHNSPLTPPTTPPTPYTPTTNAYNPELHEDTPFEEEEEEEGERGKKVDTPKGEPTILNVTFEDGTVIATPTAAQTVQEFVKYVGVERVMNLGFKRSEYPLIRNFKRTPIKLGLKEVSKQFYVNTHGNTDSNRKLIKEISNHLGIEVKVDISTKASYKYHFDKQLRNLNTAKNKTEKAPHKAILLLSIIDRIERKMITENKIVINRELENTFIRIWNRYVSSSQYKDPNIFYPLWYMNSEPFWELIGHSNQIVNKESLNKKDLKSRTNFEEYVKYARLDNAFFTELMLEEHRNYYKYVLIYSYTSGAKYNYPTAE